MTDDPQTTETKEEPSRFQRLKQTLEEHRRVFLILGISFVAVAVIGLIFLFAQTVRTAETHITPRSTAAHAVSPSLRPSGTPRPTQTPSPTPEPTSTPVPEPDFSHSVVLGSSTTEALYIYGSLPEPDYLFATGLTVDSVFTEKMEGSEIAIIDELEGKDYDQVLFAFGLNELGWPDADVFIEHYRTLIDKTREYLPDAEIYIESVLPVGIGTSQRNRFGVNQDRINEYNFLLENMASEIGAHFLDVSTELKGPDGYLPQEASADGIHPNKETSDLWAALIVEQVRNSMQEPDLTFVPD